MKTHRRYAITIAASLLGVLPTALLVAQSPAGKPGDEAAIREVVQKYVDAREIIDPKAIEALFTSDADQLVSSGEWRKGRPEVVRGTVASSKNETGSKRSITLETIRFLDPDIAIADGRYELGDRHMWSTFLFKRDPGGWRIAAIRNMLPASPVPRK